MCEIGYFQPNEGSVSCHKCEDPLTSTIPGSWNCTSCIDEYYFDTKKQTCEPCPDNAECKSASCSEFDSADDSTNCVLNGTTIETINVKEGFYRFTAFSLQVEECPYFDNCRGGRTAGDASCRKGAAGPLCEICENGYYLDVDVRRCKSCSSAYESSSIIAISIFIGILIIGAFALTISAIRHIKWIRTYYATHKERFADFSAKITAFIFTMQIIILVNQNHQDLDGIELPDPYRTFIQYMGFLTMDFMKIIPMSCIFGRVSHFQRLVAWTTVPIATFVLISIVLQINKQSKREHRLRRRNVSKLIKFYVCMKTPKRPDTKFNYIDVDTPQWNLYSAANPSANLKSSATNLSLR